MFDALLKIITTFIGRITTDHMVKVTAGENKVDSSNGFFMYVPVEGNVQFITWGGENITVTLLKGYHPIRCKEIIGSGTVVDVYITF